MLSFLIRSELLLFLLKMVSLLTVLFCFCSIAVCGKGMGLTVDPEGQDVLAVDLLSEPSEPTEMHPLEKCFLNVTLEEESVPLVLVKTPQEEEEIVLEGQGVTCKREEEPLDVYVDHELEAKAMIPMRVSGRRLERRLVLMFKHNERRYSLEPNVEFWTNCRDNNAPGLQKLITTFRVFGSVHYLFNVTNDGTKDFTTPRTPVPPPNYWWLVAVVGSLALVVYAIITCLRRCCCCCCCCCESYKEV